MSSVSVGPGGFSTAEPQIRDIPVASSEEANTSRIELVINGSDELAEALMGSIRVWVEHGDDVIFTRQGVRQIVEMEGRI